MKFFPATARTVIDRRNLEDPDAASSMASVMSGPGERQFERTNLARWHANDATPAFHPRTTGTIDLPDLAGVHPSIAPEAILQPRAEPERLNALAKHVLLVDDDSTLRTVLARILCGAGFDVSCAEDGEAGWNALCAHDFDVLVTDHDMPRLSGLELLRRIRAEMRPVPVVFISGRMPWDDADLIRLLPPGLALEKPFSMADLVANVRGVLTATTSRANGSGSLHLSADHRNDSATSNEAPWSR